MQSDGMSMSLNARIDLRPGTKSLKHPCARRQAVSQSHAGLTLRHPIASRVTIAGTPLLGMFDQTGSLLTLTGLDAVPALLAGLAGGLLGRSHPDLLYG